MAKKKPPFTPGEIRALRVRLGLTVEQAAAKLGVTPRTFMSWELPSQARKPSPAALTLLRMLADGKL